jgi:uncharacterized protein (TIGR00725 family)
MQEKITISISGAAEISHCGPSAIQRALELGRACARAGVQLATGATTGFPLHVSQGFKEVGGNAFGLSPAASKFEHINVYKLPTDYVDFIVYTGFGYPGRDLMLIKSSDAVIIGCGRIGTIHEFTIAWESEIPIGILEGEWPTDEVIKDIIKNSNRSNPLVVFDSDPDKLVAKVIELAKNNNRQSMACITR